VADVPLVREAINGVGHGLGHPRRGRLLSGPPSDGDVLAARDPPFDLVQQHPSLFQQFPHFLLAHEDDEDVDARHDVEDVGRYPDVVARFTVGRERDDFHHPRNAH